MTRWKLVAALAALAAVVIASIFVLLLGTRKQVADRPAPPPPARVDPASGSRSATPPASTVTPPTSESRPMSGDQDAQVTVANNYMDAFLQPGTEAEREDRLKDWATPEDLRGARLVSNDRLPRAKRQGQAALDPAVAQPNMAYAHVQLTDGSWWGMGLVKDLTAPKGWRVSFLEKEGH